MQSLLPKDTLLRTNLTLLFIMIYLLQNLNEINACLKKLASEIQLFYPTTKPKLKRNVPQPNFAKCFALVNSGGK